MEQAVISGDRQGWRVCRKVTVGEGHPAAKVVIVWVLVGCCEAGLVVVRRIFETMCKFSGAEIRHQRGDRDYDVLETSIVSKRGRDLLVNVVLLVVPQLEVGPILFRNPLHKLFLSLLVRRLICGHPYSRYSAL